MDNSPELIEADVYEVLRECYDPEIPVNIVDLGLVYSVEIEDGVVRVTMTLTAPGCTMGEMIVGEIEEKLLGLPGCDEAAVNLVWDPPWTPQLISASARKQLGLED
jgi:metal-sulfur cluster biosynthetic enzyme